MAGYCQSLAAPSTNKTGIKYAVILFMLALSGVGICGDFLIVTALEVETRKYSLWNIYWADNVGSILDKFGIDDITTVLFITRTGVTLSLLLTAVALILLTSKQLFFPSIAILIPVFSCTISVAISSLVAVAVWASVFSTRERDDGMVRIISIQFGYGFFTELLLSAFAMGVSIFLCVVIHAREQEYHRFLSHQNDGYSGI
mmetsp:Transcript_14891/g.16843  ORF Transcript_14891/g.16843 Transcript_14891/m.16843 type:complete len:201 (-) Transcript_14891:202-804(-)